MKIKHILLLSAILVAPISTECFAANPAIFFVQQKPVRKSKTATTRRSTTAGSKKESIEDKASKLGYNDGKTLHTMRAGFFKEDNEKQLKASYMNHCKDYSGSYYLGEKNYNNRALYEIYREAFWKGYNDANNAL